MSVIGFDTSNYTTSIAWFNSKDGVNCSELLPVREINITHYISWYQIWQEI